MEHKSDKTKDPTQTSTEPRGVLGSMWSAAGAIAESVHHAVQETVEKLQHEPLTNVGGYVAHKVVDTANAMYNKTAHVVENVVENVEHVAESVIHIADKKESTQDTKSSAYIDYFSSPTSDLVAATKDQVKEQPPATDKYEAVKKVANETLVEIGEKLSHGIEAVKQALPESFSMDAADLLAAQNKIAQMNIDAANETVKGKSLQSIALCQHEISNLQNQIKLQSEFRLELTMDVVAHLQRIADRTGDALLHETARRAHSACAKGISEAPGVHLVRVTPEQATELVNLAIRTQDHGLADFARYCQSVAATSQIGIEPSPGKIQEELAKGRKELDNQGPVHTGPGYGAAFASVGRVPLQSVTTPSAPAQPQVSVQAQTPTQIESNLQLNMEMVAHLQRIADRTGDLVLHDTARKAHSACAKGLSEAPGVHLVTISADNASELVNLAIRTQDPQLANFARYCQSVAATGEAGIEPSPGKIANEIAKGRQELAQQGRIHTGPGYGAAFASISRSTSQQNLLSRSGSQQDLLSRSSSQQNLLRSASQQNVFNRSGYQQNGLNRSASQRDGLSRSFSQQNGLSRSASQRDGLSRSTSQQGLNRAVPQQNTFSKPGPQPGFLARSVSQQNVFFRPTPMPYLSRSVPTSRSTSPTNVPLEGKPALQLTMDAVAHLQRIADRTGDAILHDTARKAHSACAKNLSDAPGVHLTRVTPDQATELVNLAIRTQHHELADFARYCQSVAATTQIAIEPTPGKILEEIEKGRQELQQQGRTHTGPGYGAAFASIGKAPKTTEQGQIKVEQPVALRPQIGESSQ